MSPYGNAIPDSNNRTGESATMFSQQPGPPESGLGATAGREAVGEERKAEHTVLVVNDEPDVAGLMSLQLRHAGYRVLTAFDGREGYEVAQVEHPDLIISDVVMPRLTGIEMCRLIRAHTRLRTTPVLLVSAARRDSESVVEGLKAGADDYLEAPYDSLRLAARAARLIERERAGKALSASESEMRALFAAMTDVVIVLDADGRYLKVAPTNPSYLYRPPAELVGRTVHEVFPEEQADFFLAHVRRALSEGRKHSVEYLLQIEGTEIRFDGCVSPMSHDSVLWIARDVTERKELEEQLRQAQKMEAVGKLAGGVAHDFNNLLTVINGYSDLIAKRLRAENPLRLKVEEIRKAGERAASLTRQLLAFSRKQVLQPKVIDLNEVVREMEKMLRRLIGEDIELRATLGPRLGSVKADPGQMEQVLLNLAVNARDAMPRGGKLTISTENVNLDEEYAAHHFTVAPGRYVILAVSDTGTGMDEQTSARIFEPFFTTKVAGRGTGLGLSTVYGIVKQSGGYVWVYSEVGVGTTFKIYLPRVDEGAQGYRQSPAPAQELRGTEAVLLAEDDELVRNMTRIILSDHGYKVQAAANGAAALSISERTEEPLHLLLTDVVMPGMSGRELADRLTRLRPGMKVLFMSGYTEDAIVHHGVLDEGVNFIQKPFTPDDLARKVREVLGRPVESAQEEV